MTTQITPKKVTIYFGIGFTLLLHVLAMLMLLGGIFAIMTFWFGWGLTMIPVALYGIHVSSTLRYDLHILENSPF